MTIETTTSAVEGIVNEIAPVVGAAVSAIAPADAGLVETAEGALNAAESVTGAVEGNLPHNTALSDIAAGVQALAATPVVQSNATAAAHVSSLSALLSAVETFFKSL